ncbi:MAG: hypothetical protein JO040_14780, partial [Gemmatimonadetes bacterium]|nr:hypothetical protein [Gemmatimonadota bacterium]
MDMGTSRSTFAILVAGTLAASACEQPASPDFQAAKPEVATAQVAQGDGPGIDGEFVRVQRQLPGFGGYYFDANGDLVVLLTDPAQEPAARALLAGVAADRPRGPGSAGPATIRVRRAEFDFATLQGWHERLNSVLRLEGVSFLDTDEMANRVTVGVTSEAAAARVRAEAVRAGVPSAALRVERVAGGGRPIADLLSQIRPVLGGL